MNKYSLLLLLPLMMVACATKNINQKPEVATKDSPIFQSYQCVGKALAVDTIQIGKGGKAGKFPAVMVEVQVTSSANEDVLQGDIIYCELVNKPKVMPAQGREYVFKARYKHPAHPKKMYLLQTDVLDLVY